MFIMLPEYDSAGLKNAVDVNNLFVILLCILFYLISYGPGGSVSTVESRSIVPAMIVFPHVLFAIFGPELSSI